MVDRVAQDRNETEDYSMKNEMENGQEPQENGEMCIRDRSVTI